MDLIACANEENEKLKKYMEKNYGEIPRCRGYRLMRLEDKVTYKPNIDATDLFPTDDIKNINYARSKRIFNKYARKDVIYIHTRTSKREEETKLWLKKYKNLFLESVVDPFDKTYTTYYFKAVADEDYKKLTGSKHDLAE